MMVLGVDMHMESKGKCAVGGGRPWKLDLPVLVWVEKVEGDLSDDEGGGNINHKKA